MRSVEIFIRYNGGTNFDKYHLFLVESAMTSGMDNLYIGNAKDEINLKVAGTKKGVRNLYRTLLKNSRKYGIKKISKPKNYAHGIPTIDRYLMFAGVRALYQYTKDLNSAT